MRKILVTLLLLYILPLGAQSQWPEPYVINLDSINISREIPGEHWQFYDSGHKEVKFKDIVTSQYASKFIYAGSNRIKNFEQSRIWVRFRLKNPSANPQVITIAGERPEQHIYIHQNNKWKHFATGDMVPRSKRSGIKQLYQVKVIVAAGDEIKIYSNLGNTTLFNSINPEVGDYMEIVDRYLDKPLFEKDDILSFGFFGFVLFAVIFNLFFYYVNRERVYLVYSCLLFFSALLLAENVFSTLIFSEARAIYPPFFAFTIIMFLVMLIHTTRYFFRIGTHFPGWDKFLIYFSIVITLIGLAIFLGWQNGWGTFLIVIAVIGTLLSMIFIVAAIVMIVSLLRKNDKEARLFVIAAMPFLLSPLLAIIIQSDWIVTTAGMWTILVLSWGMFARFKSLQIANARAALEKEEERNRLIAQQKQELEILVEKRTAQLSQSLENLKQTQDQLIQSEKMASLGELTAGIAHEIQNPLNFVNNFSDVSVELLEEMEEELQKGDTEEAIALAGDIKQNLEKIAHHGRRADGIVKGMLQHSRASSGQKEPTDVNVLADEYLRLAYHGLRAKDKSFNATLVTEFDENLPKVNLIGQDVGRVLLNLFTNAFYATQQKLKTIPGYMPTVTVTTLQDDNNVVIKVKDNGTGIPDEIRDKILQPFFTTKPTGEGTGLGLSLSYDIIVKGHNGKIDINSKEGEYSEFIITLNKS